MSPPMATVKLSANSQVNQASSAAYNVQNSNLQNGQVVMPGGISQSGQRGSSPAASARPQTAPQRNRNLILAGGCVLVLLMLLCVVVSGGFLMSRITTNTSATELAREVSIGLTATNLANSQQKITPTGGQVSNQQPTPGGTPQPGSPQVILQQLRLEGDQIIVDYETVGFIENANGRHIHFYFNTIKPEDAGKPGQGPWVMYPGPRPFRSLTLKDIPPGATQICGVVANVDHTIFLNSGSCLDLPAAGGSATPAP
jgi:hypothetical protein